MHTEKPIYAHPTFQKVPKPCFWNRSIAYLIDDGPLSYFQGRLLSASTFHTSLYKAITGVMCLALWLHVMSQAPQHFRSSETKPLVMIALPTSLSAGSFPFSLACPRQYTHRSFQRWMLTRTHSSLDLLFHFSIFVATSLNLWGWSRAWSDQVSYTS